MEKRRGYIALFITILIWGTTFTISKVVLQEIAPLQLTGLRFLLAFALIAPLAARQGFVLKDIFRREFILFGLTGMMLFHALQNLGLTFTSASSTVLILSIIPVLTTIFAVIFLKEKLLQTQIFGIILVTIGMVLVSLDNAQSADAPNPLLGNIAIFTSGLSWAVYTIQGRKMAGEHPAIVMAAASTGAGALLLSPFVGLEIAAAGLPQLSLAGWSIILYLSFVSSGVTTYTWNEALHYLPASEASAYLNLVPVIGLATAIFAGERPPLVQLIGGSIAILGVLLSSKINPGKKS